MNQNIVSIVSFLFDGAFSALCFCNSINVDPLFANNLRRLITESSLKLATARSACTRLYLHIIRFRYTYQELGTFNMCVHSIINWLNLISNEVHTRGGHRSMLQPSLYNCERQLCPEDRPQTPHTWKAFDPAAIEYKHKFSCSASLFQLNLTVCKMDSTLTAADRNL